MTKVVCTTTLPPPPITYEYVDFGLPSGTKWATQNVGARKPSDYGLYFQWGDTQGWTADQVGTGEGKKKFASDWSDYKWGASPNFTKYVVHNELDLEDDAAHVNMGGDWHMPTNEQIEELFNSTDFKFTTLDGIGGVSFTSKENESKSIFIPAAGGALNGSIIQSGNGVGCWLNQLLSNDNGCCFYVDTSGGKGNSLQRYAGLPIRGVIG